MIKASLSKNRAPPTRSMSEMGGVHRQASSPSNSARSYPGNQTVLRRLSRTTPRLQCKLTIGAVNDPLEAEADHLADQVMRMPDSGVSVSSGPFQVSRKCAACEEEDKKLQAKPVGTLAQGEAPPIVHDVLNSSGQPLDSATRAFMEPRLGHDFSKVRVHFDTLSAKSAGAVNALAYTVGAHLVFGSAQFRPQAEDGRELIAHELVHVVQQAGSDSEATPRALDGDVSAAREADSAAAEVMSGKPSRPSVSRTLPALNRKIIVDQPRNDIPNPTKTGLSQTNAKTVGDYLTTLCSAGSPIVDGSGNVVISKSFCTPAALPADQFGPPSPSPALRSTTATGCGCLCDLTYSPHVWKIRVDDSSWPHTDFDDADAADGKKPGGTGGTVTAPSPNSTKLWGAATATGKEMDIDPWLVLGHELCGHGWLGDSGRHGPDETSPRGEGGHQETVDRENALRAEHGIDLRGTFKDPDCGESYWREKTNPATVNWSSYRSVCESWRARYNAAHGTSFKITDKIP